jgi:2-iminobutanoate/2-iminopropanoate deaminase
MKKVISSPLAPAAIGPYSQATEAAGLVFVSGQLPLILPRVTCPKALKRRRASRF